MYYCSLHDIGVYAIELRSIYSNNIAWTLHLSIPRLLMVKPNFSIRRFPKQALVFTCLQYKSFLNTVEKGETNNFFFSPLSENFPPLSPNLKIVVCKLSQFGRIQNLSLGKGLNLSRRNVDRR